MKTVICTHCGARIDPEATKCPECGAVQRFRAKASPEKKRPAVARKKTRNALVTAAAALLAALTVVLCVLGGVFDFAGKDAEKMPNVVGQTETNARQTLDALGLRISVKTKASEEAAGIVIAQSIAEGKSLKSNQSVTLTVSDGSLAVRVPEETPPAEKPLAPSLVGLDYDAAKMRAENVGLNLVVSDERYDASPRGTVLWQEPEANAEMQRGEAIRCIVSLGAETEFTVTVTAGKGGSVSPSGRVSVMEGEDAEFVITPDEGYAVAEVKIDGEDVGAAETYRFEAVDADHTLYAVFRVAESEEDGDTPEAPDVRVDPATPSDIPAQ